MEKKLPGIFKNTINTDISNNKKTFYSVNNKDKNIESNINEDKSILNEYIFNIPVDIATNDGIISTKIVSKIKDHILTSSNKVIKLNDIKWIKRKDQ